MAPSPETALIPFDNTYQDLSPRLFAKVDPQPVPGAKLIRLNEPLAQDLGLDASWLAKDEALQVFAGNAFPAGASAIATAYAGHQFGHFNPGLGDGRALLLGEVLSLSGERYDLQLKGSGPTPFSRGGDGRSPLGPVLREYIVSEAMHALGVPTTRSLAAVVTDEEVVRQRAEPGGILTRVAKSHLRIGTFEFVSASQDYDTLSMLVRYTMDRHYPQQQQHDDSALALLMSVVEAQASLVAQWMQLGFVHGVMNTDNMLVSGETIDYGPCAFLDEFHTQKVFSSIDRRGRYAFENQPKVAVWNLSCLAQALLPVMQSDRSLARAQDAIDSFEPKFRSAYRDGLRAKLGLGDENQENDSALINDFLRHLQTHEVDFTLAFRALSNIAAGDDSELKDIFEWPESLSEWRTQWLKRLSSQSTALPEIGSEMKRINPLIIPRNHQIQNVIDDAVLKQSFDRFHQMVEACTRPYELSKHAQIFAAAPMPEERVTQTFCGT